MCSHLLASFAHVYDYRRDKAGALAVESFLGAGLAIRNDSHPNLTMVRSRRWMASSAINCAYVRSVAGNGRRLQQASKTKSSPSLSTPHSISVQDSASSFCCSCQQRNSQQATSGIANHLLHVASRASRRCTCLSLLIPSKLKAAARAISCLSNSLFTIRQTRRQAETLLVEKDVRR